MNASGDPTRKTELLQQVQVFSLKDQRTEVSTNKTYRIKMYAKQGVRVVRGINWKSGDQDVSDGLVGTVVKVRNNIANVVWDNGTYGSYQIGDNDSEILAHDATKNDDSHDTTCAECNEDIIGLIWNCIRCENWSLCTRCYMSDLHDVSHQFRRKVDRFDSWAVVPERSGSTKIKSRGFFPGATIVRNSSSQKGFQSLDLSFGRIINYESNTCNAFSAVGIVWSQSLKQTVHQLGKDSKVDIRCQVPGYGPMYYKSHLPSLIKSNEPTITRQRGHSYTPVPLHQTLPMSLQASSTNRTTTLQTVDEKHWSERQRQEQDKRNKRMIHAGSTKPSYAPPAVSREDNVVTNKPKFSHAPREKSFMSLNFEINRVAKTFVSQPNSMDLPLSEDSMFREPSKRICPFKENMPIAEDSTFDAMTTRTTATTKRVAGIEVSPCNSIVSCSSARTLKSLENEIEAMPSEEMDSSQNFAIGDAVCISNVGLDHLASKEINCHAEKLAGKIGHLQYIYQETGFCTVYFNEEKLALKIEKRALSKANMEEMNSKREHSFSFGSNSSISGPRSMDLIDIKLESTKEIGNPNSKKQRSEFAHRRSLPLKLEENLKEIENIEDANCKRKPDIPNKVNEYEPMPNFPSHVDLLRTRALHSRGRGGSVSSRSTRTRSTNSAMTDDSYCRSEGIALCYLCQENECDVTFLPCGHSVTCSECFQYFKICIICKHEITGSDVALKVPNCMICNDQESEVNFLPCNHRNSCKHCSLEMKHCLQCKVDITAKIDSDGNELPLVAEPRWDSIENLLRSVEKLKSKVIAMEHTSKCQICVDNKKSVVFQCGHATCDVCCETIIICPICLEKIEVKTHYA